MSDADDDFIEDDFKEDDVPASEPEPSTQTDPDSTTIVATPGDNAVDSDWETADDNTSVASRTPPPKIGTKEPVNGTNPPQPPPTLDW